MSVPVGTRRFVSRGVTGDEGRAVSTGGPAANGRLADLATLLADPRHKQSVAFKMTNHICAQVVTSGRIGKLTPRNADPRQANGV